MSHQQSAPNIPIGSVIAGKYRVERVLGQGGMGVVVAARHIDLHATFAIKLMRATELANPQAVERFLREARAALELKKKSQHVVQVYDVGRLESGEPYIVMELLHGEDLADVLKRRGPLPIDEACLHIVQACHALAEAHAMGIIHRDLKPGNLFLTQLGDGKTCIKVLDFGISKHTAPSGDTPDVEMTGTRDVMGSPQYMSPEQMRSARQVDARSDIWSLGVILYKLLTGKAPFQAPTTPEIFAQVLDAKPARPPSLSRPEIPKQLDAAILRCLEKAPLRRYGRVSDLIVALAPFTPGNGVGGDDDIDAATTVLRRPPSPAKVDLSGTIPMSEADVRAASRVAPGKPRLERTGTQKLPDLQGEAANRAGASGARPPADADGPNGTQPLDGRMLQQAFGSPAAQQAASNGLSRKTIPMRSFSGPPPSPSPPARSPSGEWQAPVSQNAPPAQPMQRRPSFVGEAPAGLAMQPPPMPAPVFQGAPQRRPSFSGEVMSPLAPPIQPSAALNAPPPRGSMPSLPLAQPLEPAPSSALGSLGVTSSSMAPSAAAPQSSGTLLPVGESTGPSMAPWGGTQSKIAGMNRRHRVIAAGAISGCIILALVATAARSRSTSEERAPASASSVTAHAPIAEPSASVVAAPPPSAVREVALEEAAPPPPAASQASPAVTAPVPMQPPTKARAPEVQPVTKAKAAARVEKTKSKVVNPFDI